MVIRSANNTGAFYYSLASLYGFAIRSTESENAMVKHRKRGIKGDGSVYQRKSDARWTGSFKTEEMSKRKYVYAPVENNTQKAAYDLLQKAMQEQKHACDWQGSEAQRLHRALV